MQPGYLDIADVQKYFELTRCFGIAYEIELFKRSGYIISNMLSSRIHSGHKVL